MHSTLLSLDVSHKCRRRINHVPDLPVLFNIAMWCTLFYFPAGGAAYSPGKDNQSSTEERKSRGHYQYEDRP